VPRASSTPRRSRAAGRGRQFEPARLEKTRDTYTQYLELKRKVPLEEIYTNDLLPEKK